ncbi:MAG TPA: hypothetical protein VEV43_05935 [Actinomycetota bacterium]|nr:hypothetical protein [Actinomycetota bacterium]
MRLRRAVRLLVFSALVGMITGTVYSATAHTECTPSGFDPVVHECDIHHNDWGAGGGYDSLFGFGGGDTLRAASGRDRNRGATGTDFLKDEEGSSDQDEFCDGGDFDYIYMGDGDGQDVLYYTGGGYTMSSEDFEEGDDVTNDYLSSGCPV